MPVFKCTMIFQHATASGTPLAPLRRLAGYTESWYFEGLLNDAKASFFGDGGLCLARAGMLPVGARIVGQRIHQADPAGATVEFSKPFPAGLVMKGSLPQLSLITRVQAIGRPNQRTLDLRSLPDDAEIEGEYNAGTAYDPALRTFLKSLNPSWSWRAEDSTQRQHAIATIDGIGLVTTLDAHGLVVGDTVNITRTRDTTIIPTLHGIYKVLSVASATTFTVLPKQANGPGVGGHLMKYIIIYPTADGNSADVQTETGTRKVGRPFGEFRGRASARRT